MKITCRACHADVPSDDLNIELAIAKCARCGDVFGFADEVANRAPVRKRAPIPTPKGIEVVDNGGEIVLSRRWFSVAYFFFAFFCLVWNGFLVIWYGLALSAGDAALPMLLIPLLHVAAGVGLSYFTLCGFVNTTHITVRQGRLHVKHGPLPWPGGRSIETMTLDQLFCAKKVHRSRKGGTSTSYLLKAQTRSGDTLKLLTLHDETQALFLEQRLERVLGIQDRPMPDELPR